MLSSQASVVEVRRPKRLLSVLVVGSTAAAYAAAFPPRGTSAVESAVATGHVFGLIALIKPVVEGWVRVPFDTAP